MKKLIEEKGKLYGSPEENFACIQEFNDVFDKFYKGDENASNSYAVMRQSITGVLRKISRIATGTDSVEHWKDVMGYAQIGMDNAGKSGVEIE